MDAAIAHALTVLEGVLHHNLHLTEEQRQEVYDALVAAGHLPRTYENHRGAGTPGEFGRPG